MWQSTHQHLLLHIHVDSSSSSSSLLRRYYTDGHHFAIICTTMAISYANRRYTPRELSPATLFPPRLHRSPPPRRCVDAGGCPVTFCHHRRCSNHALPLLVSDETPPSSATTPPCYPNIHLQPLLFSTTSSPTNHRNPPPFCFIDEQPQSELNHRESHVSDNLRQPSLATDHQRATPSSSQQCPIDSHQETTRPAHIPSHLPAVKETGVADRQPLHRGLLQHQMSDSASLSDQLSSLLRPSPLPSPTAVAIASISIIADYHR